MRTARVIGMYETALYLADWAQRKNEEAAASGALSGRNSAASASGSRRDSSPASPSCHGAALRHIFTFRCHGERRDGASPSDSPLGRSPSCASGRASAASTASVSGEKRYGFSKGFIELATGLSFCSADNIAYFAANDFLMDPLLMTATYLEWAAAVTRLAEANLMSASVNKSLSQLAETLTLMPAACLEFFDTVYLAKDPDGQYAGFALSMHLLRNESIINKTSREYAHLPRSLTVPLAPIQVRDSCAPCPRPADMTRTRGWHWVPCSSSRLPTYTVHRSR